MTTSITEPKTLANVLRALGDIPLHRISWYPRPCTATESDQIRMADGKTNIHFTARPSLPTDHAHLEAAADYAPDFAVEILSDTNVVARSSRNVATTSLLECGNTPPGFTLPLIDLFNDSQLNPRR